MDFKVSIFRNYVLPLLVIFLVPISSYYFYDFAKSKTDREFVRFVVEDITKDTKTSAKAKSSWIAFYQNNPPSAFCTGSQYPLKLKETFKDTCSYIQNYNLFQGISLWTLLVSVFIFLLVGVLFMASYISQRIQYLCFAISWSIAKIFSIAQVLIQGTLLVSLFYYGPILAFERFFPKIIWIIGSAAAFAAFKMIVALLKKVNYPVPLKGHVLQTDEAPALYSELDRICDKFNTQPPDNIILGAEDNFFVTENPVSVGEKIYSGRTLYASILHLENLSQPESSAIFAHEMAHFSGQDTWYSKKTSPMLTRCEMYFDILNQHLITLPVFFFLLVFRSLFELSFSQISREREKRADALAAKLFSGENLANALGKFVLYSKFRAQVEYDMFSKEKAIQNVNLLKTVTSGFSNYLKTDDSDEELLSVSIPHPFDSHPPIAQRIKDVGVDLDLNELKRKAAIKPKESWFNEIQNAEKIRDHLIEDYENEFMKEHEQNLAYRYLPSSEYEKTIVEKYFPAVEILSKKGKSNIVFDYEKVSYSEWSSPVYYSNIEDCEVTESMMKQYIVFTLQKDTPAHKGKVKLCISKMAKDPEEIVEIFNLYYTRYNTAIEYSEQSEQN